MTSTVRSATRRASAAWIKCSASGSTDEVASSRIVIERQLAEVDTTEPDRALLGVPESGDQVGNGGLAGAAGSHEGEHRAFLQVDRHIVEHRPPGLVGEGHMIKRDIVPSVIRNARRQRLLHLDRRVQYLEAAIRPRLSIAQSLYLPVVIYIQTTEYH